MIDWLPIVVLPNVRVREPVEMENVALCPPSDARVVKSISHHPKLGTFLEKFTDAFGHKISPSVAVVREGTPEIYRTTAAIAGFRDALAASTLTGGRAVLVSHNAGMRRPIWAESLSFYPWMIDKNGTYLLANTPSMMGMHQVDSFRGQSFAGFSPNEIGRSDIDSPLFSELSRRWISRFRAEDVSWEDQALFRSLNMAYQACMMPGGLEASFYDVGRLVSLWVSACEILVHPGPGGGSGKTQVMDVIDSADWCSERLKDRSEQVGVKKPVYRTAASSLYFRIDALRNDFLHGNEVDQNKLITDSGADLLHVAACIYRVLLMTKLRVHRPKFEEISEFNESRFLDEFGAYSYWKDGQRRHERAILKAAGLDRLAEK